MALTPRLELRQSQSLVMTPQLQQAIKLLQLSSVELETYVEEELASNPLLEREDTEGAEATDTWDDPEGDVPESGSAEAELLPSVDFETAENSSNHTEDLDTDYENLWNNDSPADAAGIPESTIGEWGHGGRRDFESPEADLEQTLSSEETLTEHLTRQLNMELDDPADRVIGLHLIDRLDEAGYLPADLTPVAEMLGCHPQRVESTLARLQQFTPSGIFARSLAECLALQLRDLNRLDPAMEALLDHLDLLARREIDELRVVCGVDDDDLAEMVAEIRALDPKPALAFDPGVVQPITPDVLMRAQADGGWIVELNPETLPRVLINNRYHAEVRQAARSREERHYVDECLQSANWLVKALHQRATTILKVARDIVRQQDGFFRHGVEALRPLVLRDIAQAIEMHESTVSRVTSNKYIATPRGIYELKYFFSPAIASASGGEAYAAESIRHRVKVLIENEPYDAILSDDKIVEVLAREGVDIARRTVAKYRESLGIPSSVQRRRQKRSRI